MTESVLDINTTPVERPKIRIRTPEDPDGKLYELAHLEELALLDQRVALIQAEQLKAANWETVSEGEIEQLDRALERLVSIALPDAPVEVRKQLNTSLQLQVLESFTAGKEGQT